MHMPYACDNDIIDHNELNINQLHVRRVVLQKQRGVLRTRARMVGPVETPQQLLSARVRVPSPGTGVTKVCTYVHIIIIIIMTFLRQYPRRSNSVSRHDQGIKQPRNRITKRKSSTDDDDARNLRTIGSFKEIGF